VLLGLPMVGDIRLKYQVASFARMLSTLRRAVSRWYQPWRRPGFDDQPAYPERYCQRVGARARRPGLAKSLEEQRIFRTWRWRWWRWGIDWGFASHAEFSRRLYEEDVQTALGAAMR